MKKNIKRALALLLTICTLWSFVPTMVVAVGDGEQLPTTVVYDFVVQDTDLVDTNNKSLGNSILTNGAVKNAIDA